MAWHAGIAINQLSSAKRTVIAVACCPCVPNLCSLTFLSHVIHAISFFLQNFKIRIFFLLLVASLCSTKGRIDKRPDKMRHSDLREGRKSYFWI